MSDEREPCTSALGTPALQEKEKTSGQQQEIDRYDPGDSNPYTREYIFKHEPFRHIPAAYCPRDGFFPSCLVWGIGLLHNEAVSYAEEHQLMGPPGSEYSVTRLFFGYQDMAMHFSKLYGRRIKAVSVLSRKCDIVFALFDNYGRPVDIESRHEVRDIGRKMVKIFPAAEERRGYYYSSRNQSMYPLGYSRFMYKQ